MNTLRKQRSGITLGALIVVILAACATRVDMSYRQPGWSLATHVTPHLVTVEQMLAVCGGLLPEYMAPRACAFWSPSGSTCEYYYTSETTAEEIEHEKAHCAGYTRHEGES